MSLRDSIPGDKERPERWARFLRSLDEFLLEARGHNVAARLFCGKAWEAILDDDALTQEARLMCRWLGEELERK